MTSPDASTRWRCPPAPGRRAGGTTCRTTAGTGWPTSRSSSRRVTEEPLRIALAAVGDDSHLPQVLLHPDLTSPNVITPPGGEPVVIDWTGAGRGARVAGLGVGLFGAGDPHLIDAFVAAYRQHVQREPEELDALAQRGVVVPARPRRVDGGDLPTDAGTRACCAGRQAAAGGGDRHTSGRRVPSMSARLRP